MSILRETIHDNRFLRLIENLLKAGYLEEWKYHATDSGTPQGGIVSPLLANIYLDRLDKFVEQTLLPEFNRGKQRTLSVEYNRLNATAHHRQQTGHQAEARALREPLKQLPVRDPNDPEYRRLRYIRYADDVRRITGHQIPFPERRGSEEKTPGSVAYLKAKARGNSSMPLKRRRSEGVYDLALQDPRDTVRATLPKPQSPAMEAYIP
jgi:hypothetical protein